MEYPAKFQAKIIGTFGEEGRLWLERLPLLIAACLKKWNLTLIGPVENLSYNYVANVIDMKKRPAILKIGIPGAEFNDEMKAVQMYGGSGCAKLIKADPESGMMLLERLTPGYMLSDLADEKQVIDHYIEVWKALRRPLPLGEQTPSITDWADALDKYQKAYPQGNGQIPIEHIDLSRTYFKEVVETSGGSELLHGDLHHENILYDDDKGWMAIDPKGIAGDPYFDCTSFMINHLYDKDNPKELLRFRVERLCEGLSFDRRRFLKASVTMSTIYACWSVEAHDPDWEKRHQCAEWFKAFLHE